MNFSHVHPTLGLRESSFQGPAPALTKREGLPHPQKEEKRVTSSKTNEVQEVSHHSPSPPSPGVLDLLQKGHFQGVADVRLRLNFHQVLAGLEHESVKAAAGVAVPSLVDAVGGEIDSFLQAPDTGTELAAEIEGLFESFASTSRQLALDLVDGESLTAGLRSAFASLEESLRGVLLEPSSDPGKFEAFLEGLGQVFSKHLASLGESLEDTLLPELSDPHGNGRAYEKFLGQYKGLQALSSETESPVSVHLVA